jgi:hypothetical protein
LKGLTPLHTSLQRFTFPLNKSGDFIKRGYSLQRHCLPLDKRQGLKESLRGAPPLFLISSPSPFKERGIKGVRWTKTLIVSSLPLC